MPLRSDIKKVLVIGSGPIVIGQAAEFDYAAHRRAARSSGGSGGSSDKLQPGYHHDGQAHGGQDLHRAADSGRRKESHRDREAGRVLLRTSAVRLV